MLLVLLYAFTLSLLDQIALVPVYPKNVFPCLWYVFWFTLSVSSNMIIPICFLLTLSAFLGLYRPLSILLWTVSFFLLVCLCVRACVMRGCPCLPDRLFFVSYLTPCIASQVTDVSPACFLMFLVPGFPLHHCLSFDEGLWVLLHPEHLHFDLTPAPNADFQLLWVLRDSIDWRKHNEAGEPLGFFRRNVIWHL